MKYTSVVQYLPHRLVWQDSFRLPPLWLGQEPQPRDSGRRAHRTAWSLPTQCCYLHNKLYMIWFSSKIIIVKVNFGKVVTRSIQEISKVEIATVYFLQMFLNCLDTITDISKWYHDGGETEAPFARVSISSNHLEDSSQNICGQLLYSNFAAMKGGANAWRFFSLDNTPSSNMQSFANLDISGQ